LHNHH